MCGAALGFGGFVAVITLIMLRMPVALAMGVFAAHASLSRSLYSLVAALIGQVRGGMAMATIGACTIFGAICG